jgi:hypothetical protein
LAIPQQNDFRTRAAHRLAVSSISPDSDSESQFPAQTGIGSCWIKLASAFKRLLAGAQ